MTPTIYSFSAPSISGQNIEMSEYQDKVILIVNTASECGLTPQYKGLEELYQQYKDQGLVILGFPCNQFGQQEPGSAEQIASFCTINYGVTFPIFDKIDVNGETTDPLFVYLKDQLPGLLGNRIKWNFTKFLIDRQGKPIKRFAPTTKPEALKKHIEALLK